MPCLPKCLGVACLLLTAMPGYAQIGTPERPKPASIEVLVTDPDDKPIPEAEVSWSSGGSMRSRPPVDAPHTDLNGKCSIEAASEGSFRIAVKREGYLDADDPSQFQHIEMVDVVLGKTAKLFVSLVRGGSFQGTVYLEDGRRLAGAIVRLQPAAPSWTGTDRGMSPKWLFARTDAQGNYAFPVVPPARYGMWIEAPDKIVRESLHKNDRNEWTGYATAIWHSSVEEVQRIVPVEVAPGEDVRGYNIVLRKTRVFPFRGVLREAAGAPVLHAKVAIRVGTGEPINLLEPRPVNALNGEFEFTALPEGHYSLLIYREDAPDSPPYSVPLEAGAADANPGALHVLRVPPWTPVGGRVVMVKLDPATASKAAEAPAGTQAPPTQRRTPNWWEADPAHVWLTQAESEPAVRGETVRLQSLESTDGRSMSFPTLLLPPGAYRFQVRAPEPWYVASARRGDVDLLEKQGFTLAERLLGNPADFIVEIRQGGMALEGLIVNEKGEPLSHSAVCAMAESPARRAQPGGAFCVRADSDGAFRSRWLSPGDWKVWALTRRPRENPAAPAFQEKYEPRARKLTVPEDGGIGRRTLVAIE